MVKSGITFQFGNKKFAESLRLAAAQPPFTAVIGESENEKGITPNLLQDYAFPPKMTGI